MKKIYLDSEFICHIEPGTGRREIETSVFDKKCRAYIEGCRYVPGGEIWTDKKGVIFYGEMITVVGNFSEMKSKQAQYEEDMASASDMQEALRILGVTE